MARTRKLSSDLEIKGYPGPSGGWGSVRSLARSLTHNLVPIRGPAVLLNQNKTGGFMCVSCAWAKPADPRVFEFCENGAKATTWEITQKRVTPEFFARHTVTALERWDDHRLEDAGRLTHPMRWDAASDKYVPVDWADAFREIGRELQAVEPDSAVFYTSGRASLEASFMYGLLARAFGTNNLPDSSNMCHETTSAALPESIGVPVGTCTLDDFAKTDCIFFFGQNVGTSSPRMLHQLQEAVKRGVPIVTFNPLRERGLEEFTNPQSPLEMLSGSSTRITSQYHQVRTGGDTAAMMGIAKALFALEAKADGAESIIDRDFIGEHTHGFDKFASAVKDCEWSQIEQRSGLSRGALEAAAFVYAHAKSVMFIYGMGLTQHEKGAETVQMMVNLALLRGNIGRPGAGICPVRGHSNVQGQRTVGITEKPEMVPAEKIRTLFGIDVPEKKGVRIVEACEKVIDGSVRAVVLLGGNLVRSVPEHRLVEPAWRKLRLTVNILTKLNRSALVHGEISYILPCLGRIEIDVQASGPQAVSMEDSTGCMHGSRGQMPPASEHLLSEPKIIAEFAKATVLSRSTIPWDEWVADYSKIRDAIAATYPDIFHDFNARMWKPGGFHRPLGARERKWNTKTGKANFIVPKSLATDIDTPPENRDVVQLITLRSNGQFNTTIYNYDDRLRGIFGSRHIVMMHRNDIDRFGLREGEMVTLATAVNDGVDRRVGGLRVVAYDIPEGCIAGYYPECNPLLPLWHHEEKSKTPAAKSIPVRVMASPVRT
ncbi:FdhF/YdeP family oxidoreductase [Bradyrhizobium sp. ARR65]|uniref:FdhF/YdeP family oxidoreductase n=1 Tax=Bradyrhizobium sp. ARR65 TaxID=1040989 RepID=UPI0005513996|nr:FdhF/YdeP family oxidoreductase [Bradyrhizobium sp. ARR65]